MNIYLFIIFFIVLNIAMFSFSYMDLRYRSLKRRYVVALYPMIIYCGVFLYGFTVDFFVGFLILFLAFYITDVIFRCKCDKDKVYIGAIDILGAPLYTVWFGLGCFGMAMIFFILYSLFVIPVVSKYMNRFAKTGIERPNYTPLLIILHIAYLISAMLVML